MVIFEGVGRRVRPWALGGGWRRMVGSESRGTERKGRVL